MLDNHIHLCGKDHTLLKNQLIIVCIQRLQPALSGAPKESRASGAIFFSLLLKNLSTSIMIDFHLMTNRYSGPYPKTLKLLDIDNKKRY